MRALRTLAVLLLALAAPAPALLAQEEPVTAGSDGVPVPKKTKFVQPAYPPEALAQGIRGIVILDLVVSVQGKVESTTVVRSVPGLDEAAIAAARQWEYEPTKVGGQPVRVRLTVPITFSLALPKLARQEGVPELRQGVNPAWPASDGSGGRATAEVTLEPDGRVGVARVLEGDSPWSDALVAALRTWRFSPPPEDAVLSFRVEAEFVATRGSEGQKLVNLKATGLQRSGLLEEPTPATPATAPAPGLHLRRLHLRRLHLRRLHLRPLHLRPRLHLRPLHLRPLHLRRLHLRRLHPKRRRHRPRLQHRRRLRQRSRPLRQRRP